MLVRRAGVAERRQQFPAMRLERVRVGHRQRRRRIEVGQVADLVGDRPTRARCGRQPLLGRQPGDDGVEGVLLASEIDGQIASRIDGDLHRADGTSRLGTVRL